MAWIQKEQSRARMRSNVRPRGVGLLRIRYWGPSSAFLLLLVSSWAQDPSQPIKTSDRSPEGVIAQQTEDSEEEKSLVFPDYVDGGGWSVQLALSNVDADSAAEVGVKVYDQEGEPVRDLFDAESLFEIPPLGSRILRSVGEGAIRRGWIEVRTGTAAVSGLLTYRDARSGIEVGVNPVELGQRFALYVEESPTVGAGVAIFKPEAASGVELQLRDEDGYDPLEGEFIRWGDFQQAARTLPEWFAVEGVDTGFLADFRGLLFLETADESEFAPLGLRFGKRTSSLSAVPAIRTQSEERRENSLVFADYVDGGGWSVKLVLNNVDPNATAGVRVEVYDPDGQSVLDLFDSDLALEIPALGTRVLRSAGSGAIRRGWIQVEADAATIGGLLTYRHAQSGIEVGVEPAELRKQFALFVEESGTVGAGLALFKPDAESSIELRLRDEEGNDPLNGLFLARRGFRQAALTLPEWVDVPGVDAGFLADFRGLLFLRSEDESPFAPLGLRFGKGTSSLSAVPAIRILDGDPFVPPTVTLSASPSSIDRGQSTTLTWSSTNAESAEITPDIGMVPSSGSREVSPNVTTTYRITVTGPGGQTATASVKVTVTVSERAALGALYEALGGAGWTRNDNWLTDAPLRDWYGVEVDSQGRVTALRLVNRTEDGQLSGIGLTGEIPAELGVLSHLRVLDLSKNQLTGPVPAQLGNLSRLTFLDLSRNQLTGPIPAQLGNLSRLRHLYLNANELTGPIPAQLGNLSQLELLSLDSNKLTGPIPAQLGNLSRLTQLFLNANELTGPIPAQLGNLYRLIHLFLNTNELTGPIPAQLGNLSRLIHLYLSANELTGPIPAQLGNLSQLIHLYLNANELTGPIPAHLGNLSRLTQLFFHTNEFTGAIPPSLLRLEQLDAFWFSQNAGLCAPGTTGFVAWLKGIEEPSGPYCNEADVASLESLYHATGGTDWTNSDGWLGEDAVSEWYGVRADSLGRVTGLDLSDNGLEGRAPGNLAQLSQLIELRIRGNALTGRLPFGLTRLPLQEFDYADTELCAPVERSFQAWLNAIASHGGTGMVCAPATDHDHLVEFYDVTGGASWSERGNWLTEAPLGEWFGVKVAGDGRVTSLDLSINGLTGGIPAELGSLSRLQNLHLGENRLTGPIPAELGSLSRLRNLHLGENRLTGPIPAELGSLSHLRWLRLTDNRLTGPIPAELGSLSHLRWLRLAGNRLTGPIPPQLGSLSRLENLHLSGNQLSGSIPTQLGGLEQLRSISLSGNAGMFGVVPGPLGNLRRLEEFLAGDTRLCAPTDASSQNWLKAVWKRRVAPCSRDRLPQAYLTQAVQSREFPVPLVAGEKALLRVFVTTSEGLGGRVPPVRARFYVRGRERYVLDIPGKSAPVPTEVTEKSLSITANAEVPGEIVQPGLEMVIGIDPEGTVVSGTGLARRIPETGRQAVEVRAMPRLDLTLIPFLWRSAPDRSIVELVNAMAKDPENHELLWATRTLLPIADLEVKAHEPVLSSSNIPIVLLAETRVIRAMEGATNHYMGMMPRPGGGGG